MTRITLIDYGASNIRSALKAFEYLGAEIELTDAPRRVGQAARLVLPGVGAFGSGMAALRQLGLDEALIATAGRGVPLLGICAGMQFLFDSSDEMGDHAGLQLIPGRVTRFRPADPAMKVPHMGWNQIRHDEQHWLLAGVPAGAHVYFVHSYYCDPAESGDVLATADYGHPFAAIVGRGSIFGIQFHPEKSQKHGLQILKNFIDHA